jgi:hypothetical protein
MLDEEKDLELALDKDYAKQEEDEEPPFVEYDIATYPADYTLSVLWQMYRNGDITIPLFQRGFVWSQKQASALIESFLMGLPVPPVFFYIDDKNKNLVIDGQQRLMSVFFFFEGFFGIENEKGKRQVFRLTGLNKMSPYHNLRFDEMDDTDKRKLEMTVLRAVNIRQLSPNNDDSCMYHIFERLNTGGTPLSPQEIRNCVYRGSFLNTLMELNEDDNWRRLLGKNLPDKHLTDVELILRAFGLRFMLSDYDKPMKTFMNRVASRYRNEISGDVSVFTNEFSEACRIINERLPQKPFSVRGPFNTSVFDSIFCSIMKHINMIPDDILGRYSTLIDNQEFVEKTTLATTDTKILKRRFELVESLLFG